MKKILVIGSTVVDIIINVDHLPTTKGDIHIINQETSLGGCGYNVSDMIRHFDVPYILFSPIGTGIYGDYVRSAFAKKGIETAAPMAKTDNGCCYCFVEQCGERTFISNHGAEYLIYKNWLDELDMQQVSSVYICGLEIEEKAGSQIVDFLENYPNIPIFFSPGPRFTRIDADLLARIFALRPILHLSDDELRDFCKQEELCAAAKDLYQKTKNTVIITCSADGACYYDGDEMQHIPAVKVDKIVDTIGAGDGHLGAVMAQLYLQSTMRQAIEKANFVAAKIVQVKGALLDGIER